jgi:hypothetical protein
LRDPPPREPASADPKQPLASLEGSSERRFTGHEPWLATVGPSLMDRAEIRSFEQWLDTAMAEEGPPQNSAELAEMRQELSHGLVPCRRR